MDHTQIAKLIDHTLLKPEATQSDIIKLCSEAKTYHFASVCINPTWVKTAATELTGTDVKVCTVVGFPLGAATSEVKAFETRQAIENGATEIDMVINIGAVIDGNDELVFKDIKSVVEATNSHTLVKVILETCLLNNEQIKHASELAVKAGANFVKTSTGFSSGGATTEAVKLMRETVGPDIGVKASGGIRDKETLLEMVDAGATRIGASAGVAIVQNEKGSSAY